LPKQWGFLASSCRSLFFQGLGDPHLESQDFQHGVRFFQQGLALLGEFGLDQSFQKIVQVPLDPFAQNKAVIAGNLPV
jgi:hypothetical protein